MNYRTHLRAALEAFLAASPQVSARQLSLRAGLSAGWVSEFLRNGSANLEKADAVLCAAFDLAPEGAAGDRFRTLVSQLDTVPDTKGAAA